MIARTIRARDNSTAAIGEALATAAAVTAYGLLGPIDRPVIYVPATRGAERAQGRVTLDAWARRLRLTPASRGK